MADEDESAVHLVDLEKQAVVSTTKLDGAPGQLLLAPDGTLFAAVRGAARVIALRFHEDGTARQTARHDTADEPFGLALTPDGATLLVTTIADAHLEALRAADLGAVFSSALPRDPRSVALTSDGARAFVTHATGSVMSVVDIVDAAGDHPRGTVRSVGLGARERDRGFGVTMVGKPMMPMKMAMDGDLDDRPVKRVAPRKSVAPVTTNLKRSATQGFGLAMIGDGAFLPEALVMTSDGESDRIPSGYGSVAASTLSTHVPFIARVRSSDEKLENATFSGPTDRACFETKAECIVPRAVADDGKSLYVACLDSDEVMVVDPAADAEHMPACRTTAAARPRLHVESPSGLAVDPAGTSVVVFSTFSRKLTTLALPGGGATEVILPRTTPEPELVTLGRTLFHRSGDPTIAKNGRACASCHVEGRDDGLVWPTPAGKRQTPMLAGRVEGTGPYGWNGEHGSLALHIKSTVKNLEGKGIEDRQIDALAAYVASMHAPARHPAGGAAVERGKAIFESSDAGCSSCHVESSRFTDLETHALGGGTQKAFDTPSLAFVGRTAPYFHDGRFPTLEAVVEGCEDKGTMMGRTKHLGADDRQALVAYLRTL